MFEREGCLYAGVVGILKDESHNAIVGVVDFEAVKDSMLRKMNIKYLLNTTGYGCHMFAFFLTSLDWEDYRRGQGKNSCATYQQNPAWKGQPSRKLAWRITGYCTSINIVLYAWGLLEPCNFDSSIFLSFWGFLISSLQTPCLYKHINFFFNWLCSLFFRSSTLTQGQWDLTLLEQKTLCLLYPSMVNSSGCGRDT